jgi:gliding motility-associated-like protein
MMRSLSLPFKTLLLFIAVLCTVAMHKALASHIAALDMNVKYIGAGQDGCSGTTEYKYEITCIIYTACEVNSATGGGGNLQYWSDNAGIPKTNIPLVQEPNVSGSIIDPDTVHSLCAVYSQSNSCKNRANQNLPGFFRWTYKQIIILPSPQTDWKFSFDNSARNAGISNIINPDFEGAYVQCMLDNLTKYNNSTPAFTFNPLPYICKGTDYSYLNAPLSPDGDSIRVYGQATYSSETTRSTFNTVAGYSLANPIGSSTGYTVDSITGTAYFNARNVGKYVLGFRADEYEPGSGKLISYIMRDVQVQVLNCTAPPPFVDSMPQNLKNATVVKNCVGTKKGFFIYACPGSNISFDLRSTPDRTNPNNQIWMYGNIANLPGSVLTVDNDGTNKPVATFKWTPTNKQYGDYTLIVTGADSTCSQSQPIVLRTSKVFIIRVARGLDAGPDLKFCDINADPVQLFAKGTQCLDVKWSNLDGSNARALNNTTINNPLDTLLQPRVNHGFVVFSSDLVGACKNRDTVLVVVDTTNTIRIAPNNLKDNNYVLCRPDYLQLDAVIGGPRPLTNFDCGIINPIECDKPDSLVIYGSPTYGAKITYDSLGTTTPVFPNYETQSAKHQFYISKGDLWEMGLRSSTIKSIAFAVDSVVAAGAVHPYENFTIKMKCTTKEGISKADGFEPFMTTVYQATGPLTFEKGIHKFKLDFPYTWDTTQNLIIEFCYSNSTFISVCNGTSGTAPIIRFVPTEGIGTLYLKGGNGQISVCNVTTSNTTQEIPTRPWFRFGYCEANNIPFKIVWTPSVFLTDSSLQQPLAYVPKTITYKVQTFGRSTCIVQDSINVYVPEHDYKLTGDTTICFGEQAVMGVENGGFAYTWHEYKDGKFLDASNSVNCVQCKDVILTPKATTTYKVVVYDSVWCLDTVTATVTVLPLPDVHILTNDTVIKYGQSLQLLVSGAKLYNWMPVTGLNNANSSYPIATPLESTKYVVGAIGSNGCRAYDTVLVSIDNRDNLFVPSGFSPNGDGKNDLFRISNLTFQRIIEFRVFNRWGQEVYNNNSNSGWDGTWKDVKQDLGNYSYVIRVGFPDGYVETYRGEVTLVR